MTARTDAYEEGYGIGYSAAMQEYHQDIKRETERLGSMVSTLGDMLGRLNHDRTAAQHDLALLRKNLNQIVGIGKRGEALIRAVALLAGELRTPDE